MAARQIARETNNDRSGEQGRRKITGMRIDGGTAKS